MNSVYILIVISIVSTLLMAGFAFLWHHEVRTREIVEHAHGNALAENIALKGENADLSEALEKTRVLYNSILAKNADLRTALEKAQVTTPIPGRPARKPTKKEAG